MKIVTYGAESTGKTSLAKALANHFDTAWVPEFARVYLQEKYDNSGEICAYNDLMPIAEGQLTLEKEKQQQAKHDLLFCDTNPLQTYYYGKAYFENFQHKELWTLATAQNYDFYFLTYIDTPWEEDDLRDKPEEREEMHLHFKNSLDENNLPYCLLKGNKNERLQKAIAKIEALKHSKTAKNLTS